MKQKFLLFSVLLSTTFFGQTLDPNFNGNGKSFQNISNSGSNQQIYDGILQPDGKLVVCGRFTHPFNNGIIARFNTDGSKDNTFNQSGFKAYGTTPYQSIHRQNDGKYLAAGINLITRVNIDGSLDTTFNTNGGINIVYNGASMNVRKVSTQADNKIIASGTINEKFAVVRLNPDGSYDPSFADNGIRITPIGSSQDNAFSHFIQADGKIIVVGDTKVDNLDFCLIRLNSDGTLDNTFGTGGITITPIGTATKDEARDVKILPSGKILIVGISANQLTFAQYNTDGTLDTMYNGSGKNVTSQNVNYTSSDASLGGLNISPKLLLDNNNRILTCFTSNYDFKVMRMLADAYTLDSSFSGGISTQTSNKDAAAFIALKSNGRIITGGNSSNSLGVAGAFPSRDSSVILIELNSNGSSYSNNTKELYYNIDRAHTSIISPIDQSIFTISNTVIDGRRLLCLSKKTSNGLADNSFGINGVFTFPNTTNISNSKPIILADGKIIVLDFSLNSKKIYKILPNGTLDNTFGVNGALDIANIDNNISYVREMTLSKNNQILIEVEYDNSSSTTDNAVLRLNLDGTLDTTFGTNGISVFRINPNTEYGEYPLDLIEDNDNKITLTVVSNSFDQSVPSLNTKVNVVRLNQNGSLDTSFGGLGYISIEANQDVIPNIIFKNNTNEYLINCYMYTNNVATSGKTLKLNNNGEKVLSFGTDGFANDITGGLNPIMTLQSDGKILKAGRKNNHFWISRYLADGSLDTSFGTNGEIIETTGITSRTIDMNLFNNNDILITGDTFKESSIDLTHIKYTGITLGNLDFSLNENTMLVYPNPIENEATFEYSLTQTENLEIALVDINGKTIKTIESNTQKSAGDYKTNLNLENLNPGIYLLQISSQDKGSKSIKLIKK